MACRKCLEGLSHIFCSEDDRKDSVSDSNELNLKKKIEELESRLDEMWERMTQYEAVMTTAFELRDAGKWRIKKSLENEKGSQ